MKKLFLTLLAVVPIFCAAGIYYVDKAYFLCPIGYAGDIQIRADGRGNGFFAAPRNGRRLHRGIDLYAAVGTPVYAARSGMVTVVRDEKRGMGQYVVIRHSMRLITLYGHLSGIAVARNTFVRQGTLVGWVGKTGNANSPLMQPHLHFEVRENGFPQDPLEYLE
jgi:murein DD-endopeptidase MepM/ murein hydrolase activator NlpD